MFVCVETLMWFDVRRKEKVKGSAVSQVGSAFFNKLIDDNCLIDLPIQGRNFTWYQGDGRSMSRLDRFLLTERWCLTCPNCFQLASSRGLSDHCPILLCIDVENWGPKPVRLLKCWENFSGYNSFVREQWSFFSVGRMVRLCVESKIQKD